MPTIYETDSLDEAIDIIQDESKVMRKDDQFRCVVKESISLL